MNQDDALSLFIPPVQEWFRTALGEPTPAQAQGWPTIAAGGFLILGKGWPADVALNLFKFLMAIYAIQGLSILGFFFDVWKVRGFLRSGAYVIVVLLMMPLLLGLGFFDLWFDFRSKVRQS